MVLSDPAALHGAVQQLWVWPDAVAEMGQSIRGRDKCQCVANKMFSAYIALDEKLVIGTPKPKAVETYRSSVRGAPHD